MKVVHVIKRVETIDNDIKELRKLEKSLSRDKSFSTPIYMTIEKQINILLGERIKLLELRIANPPESYISQADGASIEDEPEILPSIPEPKKAVKKSKAKEPTAKREKPAPEIHLPDDDDIPMLTQDQIDARFDALKNEKTTPEPRVEIRAKTESPKQIEDEQPEIETEKETDFDDTGIKLLDIALEKGTLSKKTVEKDKKVRFFRENFPST